MPAANITNGLNVADLSKFETSTTTGILKLIDGEKQYDGSSTTYSAWFEAVSSKLKGLGLTTFTSDVKGTAIDAYSNAQGPVRGLYHTTPIHLLSGCKAVSSVGPFGD